VDGLTAGWDLPAPTSPWNTELPFPYGTPDAYRFYLDMGPLSNASEKYFKDKQPFWNLNIAHTTYDEVWQSRAIWRQLKAIKPAVMVAAFEATRLKRRECVSPWSLSNRPPRSADRSSSCRRTR
jgi:hypothetical protein